VAKVRTPREERDLVYEPAKDGAWTIGIADVASLVRGDRVEIVAVGVEHRDYHVWIEDAPR
jgi:hypothetical protein